MMKKKLKIFALLCALCMAFTTLFVACGEGKKDDFDNGKSSSKNEQPKAEENDDDGWTKNY